MTEAQVVLDVDDIEVRYGAIRALKGVSFNVRQGEVVALLGANGAGKTTTQKMLRPSLGSITFEGRRIDGIPAHQLISLGVCHVPEGRHVFPRMTVRENLEMGAFRFKRIDQDDLIPEPGGRVAQVVVEQADAWSQRCVEEGTFPPDIRKRAAG